MTMGAALVLSLALQATAPPLPSLTQPVNDFAGVIDPASAAAITDLSARLKAATGDVVVVAAVPTITPYADLNEYAVKLFENNGRGIGDKGKDNGVLIVLAVKERRVRIEVGYGLEPWVTDGFAGETSREVMVPAFRAGQYGPGLRAGVAAVVARIAEGRQVVLPGVAARRPSDREPAMPLPLAIVILIFLAILVISRVGGGPGAGPRYWGGGGWSGWSSGVGPFGGGFGRSGGGFGGGFGGFGGGSSGGGGGGAGW